MYSIDGLEPSGGMGGHGFCIHLSPQYRHQVALSMLRQEHVDHTIEVLGRRWLDSVGYSECFDPTEGYDLDTLGRRSRMLYGKEARPLFSHREIRVHWGIWGPEHITVPGNACGLDLDSHGLCVFDNGVVLLPHNIDCWQQVNLILMVFCYFSHMITLEAEYITSSYNAPPVDD